MEKRYLKTVFLVSLLVFSSFIPSNTNAVTQRKENLVKRFVLCTVYHTIPFLICFYCVLNFRGWFFKYLKSKNVPKKIFIGTVFTAILLSFLHSCYRPMFADINTILTDKGEFDFIKRNQLKILLNTGADPNSRGKCRFPPLMQTIFQADVGLAKLLLEYNKNNKANPNLADVIIKIISPRRTTRFIKMPPLHWAIFHFCSANHPEKKRLTGIIDLLLKNGARPEINALFLKHTGNALQILLKDFSDIPKDTIILIKKLFLKSHTTDLINSKDSDGQTPLLIVLSSKKKNFEYYTEISRFILERGAKPSITNNNQQNCLHATLQNKNLTEETKLELAKLLLKKDSYIWHSFDKNGKMPLDYVRPEETKLHSFLIKYDTFQNRLNVLRSVNRFPLETVDLVIKTQL